jgi:hypothetical protein
MTNRTGGRNTAIGFEADVTLDNLTNATAIGNGAKVDASNKVRIGNDSVTKIEVKVQPTNGSDIRIRRTSRTLIMGSILSNNSGPCSIG